MIRHGGQLSLLRDRYPEAPEPLIDLSTGINPFSYKLPPIPETAYTRLPEEAHTGRLREAAASAYGARGPEFVAVASGTQLLISSLPRMFPAARVSVLSPTYGEHAAVWAAAGAGVAEVSTLQALEDGDVAVLCNPNNPDGRAFDAAAIGELAARKARHGGRLIVDEAFAEFAEAGLSAAPLLPRPGLMVLRSFGKAYGLAGLRLGFLVADEDVVDRVARALGPWPVSGVAIHVACRALADSGWRRDTALRLARAGARLDALIADYGLDAVGGTSLFRLVRHGNAPALANSLGRAGILVRGFDERPDWLRFALPPDEDAWSRLEAALATGPRP
ncbi:MAG: threonine-phosphate decarboxylase CobD [Defluviicoccus sp.]|nr:threonine-phosphate decarboxylase CobD [Defluviicoccus sp.]